jgi:hypothetical protein
LNDLDSPYRQRHGRTESDLSTHPPTPRKPNPSDRLSHHRFAQSGQAGRHRFCKTSTDITPSGLVGRGAPAGVMKVGVEAVGHYHQPLLGLGVWPTGWRLWSSVLRGSASSGGCRAGGGSRPMPSTWRRSPELVLAGHGVPVTARVRTVTELTGWAMHRGRRGHTRTATKNQLLGQLDHCFPGLTLVLPDVLGTKVGRLVAVEFADPHQLAALRVGRFAGTPLIVGCGFPGRRRTSWWWQLARPCHRRRRRRLARC